MSGLHSNRIWDNEQQRFVTKDELRAVRDEVLAAAPKGGYVDALQALNKRFNESKREDVILIHVVTADTHVAFLYLNDVEIRFANYLDDAQQASFAQLAFDLAETLDTHIDERRVHEEDWLADPSSDSLLEYSNKHLEWKSRGSYADGKFEPATA